MIDVEGGDTESSQREDTLDVWTFGRLDVSDPPDLTRRIMGRLGYMRISQRASRRRRMMRWAGRAVCIALAGLAVTLGITAHRASPEARRPAVVTMPAAVTQDIQHHQKRIDTMLRLLRSLPAGMQIDENGEFEHLAPYELDLHEHGLDEDVNRSAVAAVRWV